VGFREAGFAATEAALVRLQWDGCASSTGKQRWRLRRTCDSRLRTQRPALGLGVLSINTVQPQWGGGSLPRGSTADPRWPKGYSVPSGVVLSNKSWGEGGKGGTYVAVAFIFHFPSHYPAFREAAGHLPADGKR